MTKSRGLKNFFVGSLCVLGVVGMGSIPLIIRNNQSSSLLDREGPLTGSQRQRGMFLAAGQKDVGRDPDWDLKDRTWKGRRPSEEHIQKVNEQIEREDENSKSH